MHCSSCDKPKNDLHTKKSRLITTMTLFLCGECTKAKMEPRFVIVLHGRQNGPMSVAEYVKNHRYVGPDILAKEIIA
jgi:hypothetical protein